VSEPRRVLAKLLFIGELDANDPVLIARSYGRPLWLARSVDADDLTITIIARPAKGWHVQWESVPPG
jgi:hypothetical protein